MPDLDLDAIERRALLRHVASIHTKARYDECSDDLDALLAGVRGQPRADLAALEQMVARLEQEKARGIDWFDEAKRAHAEAAALERENARLRAARSRTAARLRDLREVAGLARADEDAWRHEYVVAADERDLLRAALTFYADETTWVGPVVGDVGTGGTPIHGEPPAADDRGRRARAALGETPG